MPIKAPPFRRDQLTHIRFLGGLDTDTPFWEIPPGYVLNSLNYEVGIEGGYRDIDGYERYDGRERPSEQTYYRLVVKKDPNFKTNSLIGKDIAIEGEVFREFPIQSNLDVDAYVENTGGYQSRFTESSEQKWGEYGIFPGDVADSTFATVRASGLSSHAGTNRRIRIEYRIEYDGIFEDTPSVTVGTETLRAFDPEKTMFSNGKTGIESAVGGWVLSEPINIPASGYVELEWEATQESRQSVFQIRRIQYRYDTVEGRRRSARVIAVDRVEGRPEDIENLVVTALQGEGWTSGSPVSIRGETDAFGEVHEPPAEEVASSPERISEYKALAADYYREFIQAVPGNGRILAVFMLEHDTYAIRNRVDDTAQRLWKASPNGWAQIELPQYINYDNAEGSIKRAQWGEGFECDIGGVTAELLFVSIDGIHDVGNDEVRYYGRLFLRNIADGAIADDADITQGSISLGKTKGIGLHSVNIAPDTRENPCNYETVRADFGFGRAVFGVDGVNRAFYFDGTTYAPIIVEGMEGSRYGDRPEHMAVYQNHLFLSYGRSIQHSGTGTPFRFQAIFGAAELATEGDITGFHVEPGSVASGALAAFNRNSIFILYGTGTETWRLDRYHEEVGAWPRSIQDVNATIFLDDQGIRLLETTDAYGNFSHGTISEHCRSFLLDPGRWGPDKVIGSCIVRAKNQYRVFFKDGFGLYLTFRRSKRDNSVRLNGIMPVALNINLQYVHSTEDGNGLERIYMGDNNGFVYQMDRGTSFDGQHIDAALLTHYHFADSIRYKKRFFDMVVESKGTSYATFLLSTIADYNRMQTGDRASLINIVADFSRFWGSTVWDQFTWDGEGLGPSRHKLHGNAENIAVLIRKSSNHMAPVLLSGANLRYAINKMQR